MIENSQKEESLFKTIGDVSAELSIPPHVLRFWESKFPEIKPHKRRGGHRYYDEKAVNYVKTVQGLLYSEGFTIKGAQKFLKNRTKENDKMISQQSLFNEVQDNNSNTSIHLASENTLIDKNKLDFFVNELESIKQILE